MTGKRYALMLRITRHGFPTASEFGQYEVTSHL